MSKVFTMLQIKLYKILTNLTPTPLHSPLVSPNHPPSKSPNLFLKFPLLCNPLKNHPILINSKLKYKPKKIYLMHYYNNQIKIKIYNTKKKVIIFIYIIIILSNK